MNEIELIGMDGSHVTHLTNFENPLLTEQINANFMFNFTALVDEKTPHISFVNRVKLEGQEFDIARISKKRDAIPSIGVECDHISYRLNRPDSYAEDFEGTPSSILRDLLQGTAFTAGTVDFLDNIYFKPGEKSIRECIIELANFIGAEILWDNFTVNLLQRRGSDNGLEFILSENVQGITQETNLTSGIPRYALEVDVMDLAHLPEYAAIYNETKKVNLGDTARVYDEVLNIDLTQRIVSYDRDPFQKVTPKISIGNVIRDITDYFRNEEDKSDDEEEDTSIYFKGSGFFMVDNEPEDVPTDGALLLDWLIGDVQALNVSGADFTDAYIDGTTMEYSTIHVRMPDSLVKLRMTEGLLDYYIVTVKVGTATYVNADFVRGLLIAEGEFPDVITVFVSDGEPTPTSIVKAYGLNVEVGESGGEGFWMEFGTVEISEVMTFMFEYEDGYDSVSSVTTGFRGEEAFDDDVRIVTKSLMDGNKIIGIIAMSSADISPNGVEVSIHATCRIGG